MAKNNNPGAGLTKILPKKLVIVLAVGSFVLTIILMACGLIWPEKFDNSTARFILCAGIAMNLSVFFFVLYPQEIKLTEIPLINVTIQLVGPIALCIVILLLFWKMMPEPTPIMYRFFVPHQEGGRALHISGAKVSMEDESIQCYVVPEENGLLAGVLVRFEGGRDQAKGWFKAPFYKTTEVNFQRGPGEGIFQVERHSQ